MKISIRRIYCFLLLLIASLWVHPTLAYTLTYTSQYLPMVAQKMGEDESALVDTGFIDETSFVAFRISFEVADQAWTNDITTLDITNPVLFLGNPGRDFEKMNVEIAPVSGGQVSIRRGGDIAAWNFMFKLKQIIPDDLSPLDKHIRELSDQKSDFNSSYGAGRCNCDHFRGSEYALYFSEKTGLWHRLTRLHNFYSDNNSPAQWTIKSSYLPEPQSLALFAIGFLLLGYRRLRAKKFSETPNAQPHF